MTVAATLADSYISATSSSGGATAEMAATRKMQNMRIFQHPICFSQSHWRHWAQSMTQQLISCRSWKAELVRPPARSESASFCEFSAGWSLSRRYRAHVFRRTPDCSEQEVWGIRPIAVGFTLRRLTSKCANAHVSSRLATFFRPIQLGVSTPRGCEAAVHSARRFLQTMPADNIIVKLDFSNAFSCLHRFDMLQSIA